MDTDTYIKYMLASEAKKAMEDKGKKEARRWLSRQLAWEASLDHLVRTWEKEQDVQPHAPKPKRVVARRPRRKSGLPLENPAA